MRSPFKILRPFYVSFSGGRTSAYMLRRILDAYDGLPSDALILFANTGKERDETLDFVNEIQRRWNVPIHWIEWDAEGYREVSYETAHRRNNPGSPFEELIDHMSVLPNPVARNCTKQLKIVAMQRWLTDRGWDASFHRRCAIGIRADESERAIQKRADSPNYVTPKFPLISCNTTELDVNKFWKRQHFDLQLRQHEGNCDLCFLKSMSKLVSITSEHPEFAEWWIEQERRKSAAIGPGNGGVFRPGRPYSRILKVASEPDTLPLNFGQDDEDVPCGCADGVGDWRE